MALAEGKTSSVVNFLRKYCIMHVVKQQKIYDFGEMLPTNCLKQISFNQKSSP